MQVAQHAAVLLLLAKTLVGQGALPSPYQPSEDVQDTARGSISVGLSSASHNPLNQCGGCHCMTAEAPL